MDCSWPGAPLSVEFSRQEYWSGSPFPSPEDLPDPGSSLALAGGFFSFGLCLQPLISYCLNWVILAMRLINFWCLLAFWIWENVCHWASMSHIIEKFYHYNLKVMFYLTIKIGVQVVLAFFLNSLEFKTQPFNFYSKI